MKLSLIHYKAMALRLSGLTFEEIGREVRRSPNTVRYWFQQESFRQAYEQIKAEQVAVAEDILMQAGPRAARRIVELLDDQGSVALHAAKDVLDRVGLKPVERREVSGPDRTPIVLRWEDGEVVDIG
jgi:orotate phosphoribosyltransferase-like protein